MPWKFGFPLKKLKKFCKFSLSPSYYIIPPLFSIPPLIKKKLNLPPPFWPILRKSNHLLPPFQKWWVGWGRGGGGSELCPPQHVLNLFLFFTNFSIAVLIKCFFFFQKPLDFTSNLPSRIKFKLVIFQLTYWNWCSIDPYKWNIWNEKINMK